MSRSILLESFDGVARLTLHRPSRRNALDLATMCDLGVHLEQLSRRTDVRCLVLAGSGGAFFSGADLPDASFGVPSPDENVEMMAATNRVVRSLVHFPAPVIAEVAGPAAGVGASIAFACDLVIAGRPAYFVLPFTGIGLVPDGGATLTVAASVGRARAMRLALLQERLSAPAAFDAGLIAMVCEPEDLADTVADTAHALAHGAHRALARTKAAINAQAIPTLEAALVAETDEQLPLLNAFEFREGVAAFRERRKPSFTRPCADEAAGTASRVKAVDS